MSCVAGVAVAVQVVAAQEELVELLGLVFAAPGRRHDALDQVFVVDLVVVDLVGRLGLVAGRLGLVVGVVRRRPGLELVVGVVGGALAAPRGRLARAARGALVAVERVAKRFLAVSFDHTIPQEAPRRLANTTQ